MYEFILASASPRRRELLALCGVEFTVCVSECSESTDKSEPHDAVCDIARQKCENVMHRLDADGKLNERTVIISADTSVVLDGRIFGKPKDAADAAAMLSSLSGRTHRVYTGVCVYWGGRLDCFCEHTDVEFAELSPCEIERYISTGESFDKAGAYGIQGYGARFIKAINGDFFNVVGLPVCRLYHFLCGLLPDFAGNIKNASH